MEKFVVNTDKIKMLVQFLSNNKDDILQYFYY